MAMLGAGPTAVGDFGGPRFRTHAPPGAPSGLGHWHWISPCSERDTHTAHTHWQKYMRMNIEANKYISRFKKIYVIYTCIYMMLFVYVRRLRVGMQMITHKVVICARMCGNRSQSLSQRPPLLLVVLSQIIVEQSSCCIIISL